MVQVLYQVADVTNKLERLSLASIFIQTSVMLQSSVFGLLVSYEEKFKLCNGLLLGPISWSVRPWKAFPDLCNVTL
jgi:hypothetical protein